MPVVETTNVSQRLEWHELAIADLADSTVWQHSSNPGNLAHLHALVAWGWSCHHRLLMPVVETMHDMFGLFRARMLVSSSLGCSASFGLLVSRLLRCLAGRMAPKCRHARQTTHGSNQYQKRIVCSGCGKVLFVWYPAEAHLELVRGTLRQAGVYNDIANEMLLQFGLGPSQSEDGAVPNRNDDGAEPNHNDDDGTPEQPNLEDPPTVETASSLIARLARLLLCPARRPQ